MSDTDSSNDIEYESMDEQECEDIDEYVDIEDEIEEKEIKYVPAEQLINENKKKLKNKQEMNERIITYDKDLKTINNIRNKIKKRSELAKFKRIQKKAKKIERKYRKDDEVPQIPKTIDNSREHDPTILNSEQIEETNVEFNNDEFSEYFNKTYEPKVLITFSDNPNQKTRSFAVELSRIIPNSNFRYRKNLPLKKVIQSCNREQYTDILVINQSHNEPDGLLIVHLPEGPSAHFRLSNVKITPELRKNYREISKHRPEIITNNFQTMLGVKISRMFQSLFHYEPQFKGRRAVTFHNQRDYIFFRHHRYEFKNEKKVRLQELGPRFTLRLRSLQKGVFGSKTGEYEWIVTNRRHEMEKNRRTFFL